MTASTTALLLARTFLLRPILEAAALSGERREQRCGLPERRVALAGGSGRRRELVHAPDDLLEPDPGGVEHRTAALHREAVSRQIDHVDVRGTLRDAFAEEGGALLAEREHEPGDDRRVGNPARLDLQRRTLLFDDRVDRGSGDRIALA